MAEAAGEQGKSPVLVAVDFSPDSEAALHWAARAAVAFQAPLLVVHVVHDPAEAPGFYARAAGSPVDHAEDVAAAMMEKFLEQQRREDEVLEALPDVETRIVVGLPASRILELSEESGARLVVMGGRGRSNLADYLLGSKTDRVARLSPVPVVVVKQPSP